MIALIEVRLRLEVLQAMNTDNNNQTTATAGAQQRAVRQLQQLQAPEKSDRNNNDRKKKKIQTEKKNIQHNIEASATTSKKTKSQH